MSSIYFYCSYSASYIYACKTFFKRTILRTRARLAIKRHFDRYGRLYVIVPVFYFQLHTITRSSGMSSFASSYRIPAFMPSALASLEHAVITQSLLSRKRLLRTFICAWLLSIAKAQQRAICSVVIKCSVVCMLDLP